jgi:hypothetical protein
MYRLREQDDLRAVRRTGVSRMQTFPPGCLVPAYQRIADAEATTLIQRQRMHGVGAF